MSNKTNCVVRYAEMSRGHRFTSRRDDRIGPIKVKKNFYQFCVCKRLCTSIDPDEYVNDARLRKTDITNY